MRMQDRFIEVTFAALAVFTLVSCKNLAVDDEEVGLDEKRVVVNVDQGPAIGVSQSALDRLAAYRSQLPSSAMKYGYGRRATPQEIEAWDRDIMPDGHGLPDGSGTAVDGASVYAAKCARCHGLQGEGIPPYGRLVGDKSNGKHVGNFWPYATTVFDYVRHAMPFDKAMTLTDDEVYGLTAWLLFKNDIISEDAIINAISLPKIEMPNANGFVLDNRELYKTIH